MTDAEFFNVLPEIEAGLRHEAGRFQNLPPQVLEDLTQDALVYVWRVRDRLKSPQLAVAWARTFFRGRAIDKFRARQALPFPESFEPAHDGWQERATELEALESALGQLRWMDRVLIRLRFWHDLSYGQLALLFDVSPASVCRRVHGALWRLRDLVQEQPQ